MIKCWEVVLDSQPSDGVVFARDAHGAHHMVVASGVLVTGSKDGWLQAWSLHTKQAMERKYITPVTAMVACLPPSRAAHLFVGSSVGTLTAWVLSQSCELTPAREVASGIGPVCSLWSSEGRLWCATQHDDTDYLRCYCTSTLAALHPGPQRLGPAGSCLPCLAPAPVCTGGVWALGTSPDGSAAAQMCTLSSAPNPDADGCTSLSQLASLLWRACKIGSQSSDGDEHSQDHPLMAANRALDCVLISGKGSGDPWMHTEVGHSVLALLTQLRGILAGASATLAMDTAQLPPAPLSPHGRGSRTSVSLSQAPPHDPDLEVERARNFELSKELLSLSRSYDGQSSPAETPRQGSPPQVLSLEQSVARDAAMSVELCSVREQHAQAVAETAVARGEVVAVQSQVFSLQQKHSDLQRTHDAGMREASNRIAMLQDELQRCQGELQQSRDTVAAQRSSIEQLTCRNNELVLQLDSKCRQMSSIEACLHQDSTQALEKAMQAESNSKETSRNLDQLHAHYKAAFQHSLDRASHDVILGECNARLSAEVDEDTHFHFILHSHRSTVRTLNAEEDTRTAKLEMDKLNQWSLGHQQHLSKFVSTAWRALHSVESERRTRFLWEEECGWARIVSAHRTQLFHSALESQRQASSDAMHALHLKHAQLSTQGMEAQENMSQLQQRLDAAEALIAQQSSTINSLHAEAAAVLSDKEALNAVLLQTSDDLAALECHDVTRYCCCSVPVMSCASQVMHCVMLFWLVALCPAAGLTKLL